MSPRAAEEWRWEQRVWAEEGGLAVLPCHLSPQELKNSWKMLYHKTAVRWERHGGRYCRITVGSGTCALCGPMLAQSLLPFFTFSPFFLLSHVLLDSHPPALLWSCPYPLTSSLTLTQSTHSLPWPTYLEPTRRRTWCWRWSAVVS